MSEVIEFTVSVSTQYVGSKDTDILEIDKCDLDGVPEDEWDDYVWEHLGGKDVAHEMCEMTICRTPLMQSD